MIFLWGIVSAYLLRSEVASYRHFKSNDFSRRHQIALNSKKQRYMECNHIGPESVEVPPSADLESKLPNSSMGQDQIRRPFQLRYNLKDTESVRESVQLKIQEPVVPNPRRVSLLRKFTKRDGRLQASDRPGNDKPQREIRGTKRLEGRAERRGARCMRQGGSQDRRDDAGSDAPDDDDVIVGTTSSNHEAIFEKWVQILFPMPICSKACRSGATYDIIWRSSTQIDRGCLIDSPEKTMAHGIIGFDPKAAAAEILKCSGEKIGPRTEPLVAVSRGSGGGKTRCMEETRRKLLEEKDVLVLTLTFNNLTPCADDRFKPATDPVTLFLLGVIARVVWFSDIE